MKKVSFTKMCGAGNDFIIVNASAKLNAKSLAKKYAIEQMGLVQMA